jgi:hypothetical protein
MESPLCSTVSGLPKSFLAALTIPGSVEPVQGLAWHAAALLPSACACVLCGATAPKGRALPAGGGGVLQEAGSSGTRVQKGF